MRALIFVSLVGCIVSNPPPTNYGPPPGPPPNSDPSGGPNGGSGDYAATVSNQQTSPVVLACDQKANNVKGAEHTAWYMQCPPCAMTPGGLWGTGIYTDDSRVCAAALHSGALPPSGGVVLVTWVPGQLTYIGSARNSYKSDDYGRWPRGFFVQGVDATGRPVTPPPEPPPPNTVRMSCAMAGNTLPPGSTMRVMCPANCESAGVWGTDVYTGDSRACVAAMHAGLITKADGGTFTISLGGPQPSFAGSARNGVTSSSYPSFASSFTVAR